VGARMALDVTVDLIGATVEVEQPMGAGMRTVGTGFLMADPAPDGTPRIVLVTANHVLARMKGDKATVGFRTQQPDGAWLFTPQKLTIRSEGKALWRRHPTRDVAVIAITVPPEFAKAAIPLSWLASDLERYAVTPGEEMMTLGFPQGLSSNTAGFPILRAGRVASYPLGPASAFPTFLLDFRVFPGNSGGPVYAPGDGAAGGGARFIAGMLTQDVEIGSENLQIGIVTQARFIRETVALLDGPAMAAPGPADGARPAGHTISAVASAAPFHARAAAADADAVEP